LHSSQVKYTDEETARMQEIMKNVMADTAMPTTAVYNEFWTLLNKHGQICGADIDATKAAFSGILPCQKIFYGDALKSVIASNPVISDELVACQKSVKSLMTESKWNEWVNGMNNDMRMIAKGLPVYTSSGKVILVKDAIQKSQQEIDSVLARLDALFSSVTPIDTGSVSSGSDTATKSDNDLACERDHGPSRYVELSAGQGAYCDCLKGYIPKPMKINGTNSSWCVKQ